MAEPAGSDGGGGLAEVEAYLLGEAPHLTRREVAERSGIDLEVAMELWRLLGFPHTADDDPAFTDGDVAALRTTQELMRMGVISEDSQAALVRTWARSFARLAEWQTELLAGIAVEDGGEQGVEDGVEHGGEHGGEDAGEVRLAQLATGVLPRVEALQAYVWRRHLASAVNRLVDTGGATESTMSVGFVDIVGYTTRSRGLAENELAGWIEHFEQEATGAVIDQGGRVIKTIGDEVLYVADAPEAAVEVALALTARGDDEDDPFPQVRAGIAHGQVLSRLGDVYGPTVNIASRLTSVARPGTVVVDQGAYAALSGLAGEADHPDADGPDADDSESAAYRFKRLRRASVKGYSRLQPWRVRRA